MAGAFENQCHTRRLQRLSFGDRFGILENKEWESLRSNRLVRLISSVELRYLGTCIVDVEYHVDRKLDCGKLLRPSGCDCIRDCRYIIMGDIRQREGIHFQCPLSVATFRNSFTVRYIRNPDLLNGLVVARGEGICSKMLRLYQKLTC